MDNQSLRYERLANKNSTIGKVIEECADYEEIGTVEEFRELKNKQNPKKPLSPLHECSQGTCPICYAMQFKKSKFCYNCAQALDWGEQDEQMD